jgi:hypothetical protein
MQAKRNSEVIVKETEGLKVLGLQTGLFKKLTDKFKQYKETLKRSKADALQKYKSKLATYDDKGYDYPNDSVFKFKEDNLGDLLYIQEILLRTQIVSAIPLQKSFQDLKFYELLPKKSKKVLSYGLSTVLRYKRLQDLFFRAAAIRQKSESWISEERWKGSFWTKSDVTQKYHLPEVAQLETLVKYSLDTPLCLNIIFGKNGLKQYDTNGKELDADNKRAYYPEGDAGSISLGYCPLIKGMLYIDKNGKIAHNGIEYDIVGLDFTSFKDTSVVEHETKPNEKPIDIMKQKGIVDNFGKYFVDRFFGSEYLPNDDHWNLEWSYQDDNLHKTFNFEFRKKISDTARTLIPTFTFERKKKTRQMKLLSKKEGGTRKKRG